MKSDPYKFKIVFLARSHQTQIEILQRWLGSRADILIDEIWDTDFVFSNSPDLLVFTDMSLYAAVACLEEAKKRKIPTLMLQDGILEWRCQYLNPLFGFGGGGPQHQPVMTDKIACIGAQSARQIAGWGNVDKVELTGMVRMDRVLGKKDYRSVSRPGRAILVMTAMKPWFDERQKELILKSLRDLKEILEAHSSIKVFWRLTRRLEEMLGVENSVADGGENDLLTMIEAVDAVITTPSTAGLEAMLLSRPVAFMDYTNSPRFVPTAWSITAREHIEETVKDLLNPPLSKVSYQMDILQDVLQIAEPAAGRVSELMMKMAEAGRNCRESGGPEKLSSPMLETTPVYVGYLPSLASLYPEAQIFSDPEPKHLQIKLALAQKENETFKAKLRSRSLAYWIDLAGRYFVSNMRARKRRVK